jgi:hypothetical protein
MAKVFAWLAFCLSALPSRKHGRNQTVRDGAISWTHSKSTLSNGRVSASLETVQSEIEWRSLL